MTPETPIACTLTARELSARLAEMADLGRAALLHADRGPTGAELRFAAGTGVRERVEEIAAVEAECCPFLVLHVTDAPDEVVLTIDAPEDAGPVLEGLVGAFEGTLPAGG